MPLFLSPTAMQSLYDPEGDKASARAAEKFDTYKTLVWVNDKNKKLTHENLQFYKWTGEQFEGGEPVIEIDPDDIPEPITPEEFDKVYTSDDIKE